MTFQLFRNIHFKTTRTIETLLIKEGEIGDGAGGICYLFIWGVSEGPVFNASAQLIKQ